MKKLHWCVFPATLACAAALVFQAARPPRAVEERLWRHRNLGKAFYENPTTHAEAVEEFRRALELAPDSFRERLNYGLALLRAGSVKEGIAELEKAQKQDPSVPHTWFNLGVACKREGRYPAAIEQFERMVRLAPDEPVSHYNLGLLYNLTGQEERALKEFRVAAGLDANLVAPRFQLYNANRLAGREAEAAKTLAEFQRVKEAQKAADESEDMEWSYYAEIYDPRQAEPMGQDGAPLKFQARRLSGSAEAGSGGMLVLDADGDARPDLLAWSRQGVSLYKGGTELVAGQSWPAGVISAAAGDFDNDGLVDLCLLTETEPVLYHNAGGRFERVKANLPAGRFRKAFWLDYDHDYDLDLFLLGAKSAVVRSEGAAGFRAVEFPFQPGEAIDGVPFRLIAHGKGFDFVVSRRDGSGVLYRDLLGGKYEAALLEGLPAGAANLQAFDIDSDGWLDVAFSTEKAVAFFMNRQGRLEAMATPAGAGGFVFADLANRGAGELVAGGAVYRNRGLGRFAAAETPAGLLRAAAWAEADFDQDGRVDLAAVAPDGSLQLLVNQTATRNRWLRVGLNGVKNLKLGAGAEIEVKAGTHYQKKTYQGTPLLFGLGSAPGAETVRITWANGMIQNQTEQRAGQAASYKEAPRLSGSCPMIFAWNGQEFQFIADVLGVAPLGASAGEGKYFPVDHDEYVQIAGRALAAVDGRYEIRLVNELREVSYVDQVRLIAVDHPAGVEVFTNDKFKAPPFPEFRLFGVERRIYPARAVDDRGRDVLPKLLRRDRAYPDEFRRDATGVAEMHALELEFPGGAARDGRAALVLHGWVDWADGSTFLGAAQEGRGGLVLPYLQVKDASGRWQTVIQDMGIPAGMPKTIVVDLTGRFLSAARAVRIVTNLCVYWDEIFLSEETAAPHVRLTEVEAGRAELGFHGFSELITHPERKQPETFIYSAATSAAPWDSTPGLYTRYGEVGELLREPDDRYVIMASGDELRLRFDSGRLPPLPSGWKRDFLLKADGWEKDQDANTAFSQSVEPLPFHAMSGYPYGPGERYPDDALHQGYLRQYNTRPALRLLAGLKP